VAQASAAAARAAEALAMVKMQTLGGN